MTFKPNELRPEHVDDLELWQLLVAVCHYGPTMGDCIRLNYSYTLRDKIRWITHDKMGSKKTIYCEETALEDDIELDNPIEAIETYAGFDWKEWARKRLKKVLAEYWEDEEEIG